MAEPEPQAKKPVKPSDKYAVQLVETEKDFGELQQYVKSETERLEKIGYKPDISKGEHMPGLDMGLNMKTFDDYKERLDIARGVLPKDEKRREQYERLSKRSPQVIPRIIALVLRDKETGQIAGYTFQESKGYGAHQDMIYVPPESRKQGLFKILVKATEDTAKKFNYPFLELKVENDTIRGFLEKEGYQKDPTNGSFRMVKRLDTDEESEEKEAKAEA
jgi:GNAT superfamily N-acetyltransferase